MPLLVLQNLGVAVASGTKLQFMVHVLQVEHATYFVAIVKALAREKEIAKI